MVAVDALFILFIVLRGAGVKALLDTRRAMRTNAVIILFIIFVVVWFVG
jgi:hypothetical protein